MRETQANCLREEQIAALFGGGVSAEEQLAIDAHVDVCARCFELVGAAALAFSGMELLSWTDEPRTPSEPSRQRAGAAARPRLAPGRVVGNRYTILGVLGVGGMGIVYGAQDQVLLRRVALKVLLRTGGRGEEVGARSAAAHQLVREARALGRLSHPNLVVVYDVGELDGEIFIVLEYVDGQNGREWQHDPRRTRQEILCAYIEASRALAAAHAAGVVHRDFKAENMLIAKDGRVRVGDFGLASLLSGEDEPEGGSVAEGALGRGASLFGTAKGTIIGTPAYMAPEQHRGAGADARSDQFAFCVSLYEALYGVRPFQGRTVEEYRGQVLQGRFAPPPEGRGIPPAVRAALVRGMQPAPEERFASMDALATALADSVSPGGAARPDAAEVLQGALVGLTGAWDRARRDVIGGALAAARDGRQVQPWSPLGHNADERSERWLAIVRASQEAFVAGDIERYVSYFAEDAVASEPTAPHIQGRDNIRLFLSSMMTAFTFALEEPRFVVVGAVVSMNYRLRVMAPDGRSAVLDGAVLFEMNARDQIARITSFYDPTLVARLIGG